MRGVALSVLAVVACAPVASATNFAVLFGDQGGPDRECSLTRDGLVNSSVGWFGEGNRLRSATGDTYTPWDFGDSDDGTVVNPLYEAGNSGENPLFEAPHLEMRAVPRIGVVEPVMPQNGQGGGYRFLIDVEFVMRPVGGGPQGVELVARSVGSAFIAGSPGIGAPSPDVLLGSHSLQFAPGVFRFREVGSGVVGAESALQLRGAEWDLSVVVPAPGSAAGLLGAAALACRRRRSGVAAATMAR